MRRLSITEAGNSSEASGSDRCALLSASSNGDDERRQDLGYVSEGGMDRC